MFFFTKKKRTQGKDFRAQGILFLMCGHPDRKCSITLELLVKKTKKSDFLPTKETCANDFIVHI